MAGNWPEKWKTSCDSQWPPPARPTTVGREILPTEASGCPFPPWLARVAGGRHVFLLTLPAKFPCGT